MSTHLWSKALVHQYENEIAEELVTFIEEQRIEDAVTFCFNQIFGKEQDHSELKLICYIIAALNMIAICPKRGHEYNQIAHKLEKYAKSLLEKNNVKSGKSKISFIHGQLKQAIANVHRTEGNGWSALWESSMGLYMSRGSANPFLPFQHLSFAMQAIDNGIPSRVLNLLGELKENLPHGLNLGNLMCLEVKALRLSGQHHKLVKVLSDLDQFEIDKPHLQGIVDWEKAYSQAILNKDSGSMHKLLFRDKEPTAPAYAYVKYAFWLRCQSSRELQQKTPKVAALKRWFKKLDQQNHSFKRHFKVLQGIEDSYDTTLPIEVRLRKVGTLMGYIENLDAEFRLLALAAIARWLSHRQKQMATIFHAEYTSLSLKMSDGYNRDVLNIFAQNDQLAEIEPFYSRMQKRIDNENHDEGNGPGSAAGKALFQSCWYHLNHQALVS
jgi:hypothetical protein